MQVKSEVTIPSGSAHWREPKNKKWTFQGFKCVTHRRNTMTAMCAHTWKTHHKTHAQSEVGGQTERKEKLWEIGRNGDRVKRQELIGGEPKSETVDSVEKQCCYCQTAVSAFSVHTHTHTRTNSMDRYQNTYMYKYMFVLWLQERLAHRNMTSVPHVSM